MLACALSPVGLRRKDSLPGTAERKRISINNSEGEVGQYSRLKK
jgi:hypothetical protein